MFSIAARTCAAMSPASGNSWSTSMAYVPATWIVRPGFVLTTSTTCAQAGGLPSSYTSAGQIRFSSIARLVPSRVDADDRVPVDDVLVRVRDLQEQRIVEETPHELHAHG